MVNFEIYFAVRMKRIFIFPVHGASFSQVIENVRRGDMPNFLSLIEDGVGCIAKSVFSTCTAVDYTSMFTGCTHETHGIHHWFTNIGEFFFDSYGRIKPSSSKFWANVRPYTRYDLKVPPFWDLLTDKRTIVLGIYAPIVYPALPMPRNGIMVSGWSITNRLSGYLKDQPSACNNPDIRNRILEHYPEYWTSAPEIRPPFYPPGIEGEWKYLKHAFKKSLEFSKNEFKAREFIFQEETWDIFISESQPNDIWQHYFWPLSEDNPHYDSKVDSKLRKAKLLEKTWRHTDDMLGSYLDDLPKDTNVIVISNHGNEEIRYSYQAHTLFTKYANVGIIYPPAGWKMRLEAPKWAPPIRADHNHDGIFIASGPDFKKVGIINSSVSIMDLVPMVFKTFHKSIPKWIDGIVPKDIMVRGR